MSQSTVSMVLAGTGEQHRISSDTRRRVLEAARRLRYAPLPTGRPGPASARGLLLGVHTFEPIFPTSTRDYYFAFLRAFEEQAVAEGCNLVLFTAIRAEGGIRRIYEGDVNGLRHAAGSVLLGHHTSHDDLLRLHRDGYPFVYVGRREVPGADIAYVGGDYRAATGSIVHDLVELGHRGFAYLGEKDRTEPQVDRWEGFLGALAQFGLTPPDPVYTAPDGLTTQWLDEAVEAGTTAILVESVSLLRVLATMARLRGLDIPGDLSVVLLVDDPDTGTAAGGPAWATLTVPRDEMGRRAVRLLAQLLTDPFGEYERQVLVPCAYHLHDTVGTPRPEASS